MLSPPNHLLFFPFSIFNGLNYFFKRPGNNRPYVAFFLGGGGEKKNKKKSLFVVLSRKKITSTEVFGLHHSWPHLARGLNSARKKGGSCFAVSPTNGEMEKTVSKLTPASSNPVTLVFLFLGEDWIRFCPAKHCHWNIKLGQRF